MQDALRTRRPAVLPDDLTVGTESLKHRAPGAETRPGPAADDLET